MKKSGLIIAIVAVMFSILITLTGCDEKSEENKNNKENLVKKVHTGQQGEIKTEKGQIKDGIYTFVTYKIDGGKLVGNYYSMTYIDHSNGGEYTTKEINDKIEIYVLSDGSLRDVTGYGISLDNTMCVGALYKLSEEN